MKLCGSQSPKKGLAGPGGLDNPAAVNFYYGSPAPYAESIAPSHHSTYAHYYDEEGEEGWEMPNFYNETYMKGSLSLCIPIPHFLILTKYVCSCFRLLLESILTSNVHYCLVSSIGLINFVLCQQNLSTTRKWTALLVRTLVESTAPDKRTCTTDSENTPIRANVEVKVAQVRILLSFFVDCTGDISKTERRYWNLKNSRKTQTFIALQTKAATKRLQTATQNTAPIRWKERIFEEKDKATSKNELIVSCDGADDAVRSIL